MKKGILGALLCFFLLAALIPSGTVFAAEESLFDRFIPIEQTYSAYVDNVYNLESRNCLSLKLGTKFDNEMGRWSIDTELKIKRSDYKGGFLKLKYVGKFGSLSAELVEHVSFVDPDIYAEITTPPYTTSLTLGLDINKDTAIVQIDLYDADKKFVRTISPGTMILASSDTGEFVTYSNCYQKEHVIYFSHKNDLFAADADESNSRQVTFEYATATVHNKEDIDKLLSASSALALEKPLEKYNYISHPEATGQENINANELLSDHEFITPDNTYYYIGIKDKEIDPIVLHKIENVVDYTRYNHSISPGYTQRNIVAADGTLYGLTNKHEKRVLASNVAKTSVNHYMTKDGKVIELESGKVIATDCKDFAEANSAWAIGVIKKDNSFWLGHTYLADKKAYEKGLMKKLDNAKLIVPEGVVDSNNTFYRWNETETKLGINENAFSMGLLVQKSEYSLSLVNVCSDAIRVFPYEKLSRIGNTEEIVKETMTGFVLTKNGVLYGYSLWHNEKMGDYGMVKEIFPVRKTVTEGNFIGILSEGSTKVNAVVCRTCDNNRYKKAPVFTMMSNNMPDFVSVTRNGFLAADGIVYSFTDTTQGDPDGKTYATANLDRDFGQMHRESRTFKAYGFGKEETINLLPSVTAWEFDNKRTCVLERSDGSVWMAAIHPNRSGEPIFENLDGFENSNAIQITQPTTKKSVLDYVEVGGGSAKLSKSFSDVKSSAYYADAVAWAVEKQITAGTSDTTFSPDNTCTRAQILTFLWRAVGSPKMASGANPFSDIKQSDYYYDAAIWASQMGMVSGNRFDGNTPCTRSATVVYLWQNAGSPFVSYNGNFADVSAGSDYAQAVAWAVANNVTSGTSATTFSPVSTCTRGQIVTFLMRALNK